MVWRGGTVCAAGVICLALAGCDSLKDLNVNAAAFLAPSGGDRVVAGSLEVVAGSTEEALKGMGLFVNTTREGEAIRIRATRSGQHFSLVLTRQKTDRGEMTHIRFEWDDARDEGIETQILSQVEVQGQG
jgi:hypothetical protein